MKKVIAILLTVILAASLFACGTPKVPIDEKATPAPTEAGEEKKGSFTADDLYFEIDGKKFTFRGKLKAFIDDMAAVGITTYQMEEMPSCHFGQNGKDVTVTYDDGFQLFAYPAEPCESMQNTVEDIYVTCDRAVFKNGVKIGSTKEDVIAAYGDGYFNDGDDCIVYNETKEYDDKNNIPSLFFFFEENVVAAVDVLANDYQI